MKKLNNGFTLLELLVVIAIIGILTTLLFANFNAARQRGRDAQRKADLRNLQTALRIYYNDNGGFPISSGSPNYQIMGCGSKVQRTACSWGGAWITSENQTYMSVLPKDPLDQVNSTVNDYRYSSTGTGDDYTIQACLENKSDDKGQATGDLTWCSSGTIYQVRP